MRKSKQLCESSGSVEGTVRVSYFVTDAVYLAEGRRNAIVDVPPSLWMNPVTISNSAGNSLSIFPPPT